MPEWLRRLNSAEYFKEPAIRKVLEEANAMAKEALREYLDQDRASFKQWVAEALNMRCQNEKWDMMSSRRHLHLVSGRASKAHAWPRKFCKAVVEGRTRQIE